MASTKIINVLKEDSFEEIIDLFENTPAKEVIFVLPKKAKSFSKEEHFATLKEVSSRYAKTVSFLCSNPAINKLAQKHKFDVLLAKDSESDGYIEAVNELEEKNRVDEEDTETPPWGSRALPGLSPIISKIKKHIEEERGGEREENIAENSEPEYQLVRAVKIRKMEDIIPPDNEGRNLKISNKKDKSSNISVKSIEQESSPMEEIKSVWQDSDSDSSSSIWAEKIKLKTHFKPKRFLFRKAPGPKGLLISTLVLALVILGAVIYVSSGSAKITIKPQSQPIDFKMKVLASDKFSSVDMSSNKIPGQAFIIEKSNTQTFKATGQKDAIQKSRGKITVYNELSASPQPLVATTRFESENGLVYRTLKTIIVPGGTVRNGSTVPGNVDVEIIADKAGPEYNIPPGQFKVVAFREKGDTEKYQKIYGRSSENIRGGISGQAIIVTDKDYLTAIESLTNKLRDELSQALKSQTTEFKVIDTSGIVFNDPVSTAKPDDAANDFTVTVSGSVKTIGFKEEDLQQLIKNYVEKSTKLIVISDKIGTSFDKIKIEAKENTMEFTANITGKAYPDVDPEKIISDLLGKNETQIQAYLKAMPEIDSAKVTLSPFWIKSMPKDKEKISYKIEY